MRSGMKMLMAANRGQENREKRGYGGSEPHQNYGEGNYSRMGYDGAGMEYGRSEGDRRNEMRGGYSNTEGNYSGTNNRSNYTRNEYPGGMRDMDARFRDRRGREHYDNGRFAPMRNEMGESMDDMEEIGPESRRRISRRRDGTFAPRSEMREEHGGEMHYPMYPSPIYEDMEQPHMNRIGFEAESDGQKYRGNIVPMRSSDKKLTHEMAEEWMAGIQNEDGSKGPKWTLEETKRVMKQKGIEVDPVTFWVVMNALYSDYCNVLKKHNVSTIDLYADLACAWIMDKDAVKDKAGAYYMDVVRH